MSASSRARSRRVCSPLGTVMLFQSKETAPFTSGGLMGTGSPSTSSSDGLDSLPHRWRLR